MNSALSGRLEQHAAVEAAIMPAPVNAWAVQICTAWQKSIDGILETGVEACDCGADLARLNPACTGWTKAAPVFTAADGLPHERCRGLHLDRSGDLWIGTKGGLCRLRSGPFTPYGRPEGLPHDKDTSIVGNPDPHIVGPAHDIYEFGEATGRIFPVLDP